MLLAAFHEARSHTARPAAVLDRTGLLLASDNPDRDGDWLTEALDQPAGAALLRLADRSSPWRPSGRTAGSSARS